MVRLARGSEWDENARGRGKARWGCVRGWEGTRDSSKGAVRRGAAGRGAKRSAAERGRVGREAWPGAWEGSGGRGEGSARRGTAHRWRWCGAVEGVELGKMTAEPSVRHVLPSWEGVYFCAPFCRRVMHRVTVKS